LAFLKGLQLSSCPRSLFVANGTGNTSDDVPFYIVGYMQAATQIPAWTDGVPGQAR
jgi:hypothetical protein